VPPKTVAAADIQCLYAFLAAIQQENAPMPVFSASTGVSDGSCMENLTAGDLLTLYGHLASKIGRNNALFQVSLRARDKGWQMERVVECLADVHANRPASGDHPMEGPEQRQREAVGTIESAFSRPPRPRRSRTGQLPNSVREALLQLGQTHTLRVLEGLQLRRVQPGQVFTYREAVQTLSGLVGQWSIRRAMTATAPDGTPIFAVNNPSPRPPTPATADREVPEPQSKQRFLIRGSKPTSNPRGRSIQRYFTMPGVYELCQQLGVQPSGSDTVTEVDLKTASGYRQALHREYIKRRPGQYPRSWLAQRLGVSICTEQRYNLAAEIHVQARYDSVLISWSNLNAIADFEVAGTFLQDERGKRYPAKQAIAAHLLAQRHTVLYRRQRTNHYSCGDTPVFTSTPPPRHPGSPTHRKAPKTSRPNVILDDPADNGLSRAHGPPVTVNPLTAGHHPTVTAPPIQPTSTPAVPQQRTGPPVRSTRYYRRPLADSRMEHLAGQVHAETGQGMSLTNARRLVDTYGAKPVEFALKRMWWLRQKDRIRSPAGFLLVASRIAWRAQHGATELGMAAPRFRGECGRNTIQRNCSVTR
jgi:hypothetical protein